MRIQVYIGSLILMLMHGASAYACKITPSFTNSTSHTCGLPTIVSVTNTSTGNGNNAVKYWWKVDNTLTKDTVIGKSSATLLLKHPGTNVVKLFVKDSSGCIDSVSTNITVTTGAKSVLDQNLSYTYQPIWTNCLQYIYDPDTFTAYFRSADTLKTLRIDWGDGTWDSSRNNLNPNTIKSHLYTGMGIFSIKIITTNGACTDTVYGTVNNQRQPTAGIIGPPSGSNRGCVPHTLRIVNASYNISNNTVFTIDWGNGDIDKKPYTTLADTFYHTYRKGICAGIIKITATNVCGSSFSTWNPIDISDRDKALWSVSSTCNPSGNFVFQNLSTDRYCLVPDIKEYFWDFGDSITIGWTGSKASQSHNYKKEGNYIVTLIAKTACGYDTFKGTVSVFYNPVVGMKFNNNRGCLPLSVTLTDTSKGRGLSRKWTINDGGTIKIFTDSILNYTFTKPGNNTVNLTVSNICNTSSLTRTFVVTDKPKARFANIVSNCIPVTVNFSNTASSYFVNQTYSWDFGDGTTSTLKNPPSKVYYTAGNYTVRLIVSDSCGKDTFRQTFTAYSLPVSKFNGDTVACTFDTLRFNNHSKNSNQFIWNFGDNQTLTKSDSSLTTHIYTVPGTYTVTLISGTPTGCKDTSDIKVLIKPGAKAHFNIDKTFACIPATFKFTNNSVYGKDYFWYANGKLVSTAFTPNDTNLYTDSNIVKLKLIVTSNSSCQNDSLEKIFFTAKNPKAIIAPKDSGCGPLTLKLTNNSSHVYVYNWNLGNGQTSQLAQPTVTYTASLVKDTFYSLKLKVYSWAGCQDSANAIVKVFPSPTAKFNLNDSTGCGPLTLSFSNQSSTNNKDPFSSLKHSWNFGDGSSDTATNPTHTFHANLNKDTIYTVRLISTSINGCTNNYSRKVRVYPLPKIAFNPDKPDGCAILNVNFSNKSVPSDTGSIAIMTFDWYSGNGIHSKTRDFSASYKASSNGDTIYPVKLIGYSEHGCVDSLSKNIIVHPQPVAAFNTNDTAFCTPANLSTINNSKSPDGLALSHNWDFGNAYTSTFVDDSTIYNNYSDKDVVYHIVYQAISAHGCRDTAIASITVHPKPRVAFKTSGARMCAPAVLQLRDSSVNAFKYFWAEGINIHGNQKTQTLVLQGIKLFDTSYMISHAVESIYGCLSDTAYSMILINARPDAGFSFLKDSSCAREFVTMLNTSLGSFKYNWNLGDNTISTAVNPKHKYVVNTGNGKDTLFTVTLEAISPLGCRDTLTKRLTIVSPTTDGIKINNPLGCTDLHSQIINSSSLFKTKYWDLGDNSGFYVGDTVNHTYVNASGNITFQPKITLIRNKYYCNDTATSYAFVYPRPVSGFNFSRQDPCNNGDHVFTSQSGFASSLTWMIDSTVVQNLNSFTLNLPSSYYRDTQYSARLIVSNIYNCSDTSDQVVKVKAKILLDYERHPVIACENAQVNFINKSKNTTRYLWKFGDGGLSNDVNPSHTYKVFGNYFVTLYGFDKDGCIDSSNGTTLMKILERPKADFTYLPAFPKLPNAKVDFTATPTMNTAAISSLSYDWDFGDGQYPETNFQQQNPSHTYTIAGTIPVTLRVVYQGCNDSITKYIFIEDPKPNIVFTADTMEGCTPLTVHFKNSTTHVQTYRWIFGDGTPDSYDKEPIHTFTLPGKWDVTLVATGTGGTSTLKKQYLITTYPSPTLEFFTTQRYLSLPAAVFNMRNNSNSVYNYWDVFDSTGAVVQSSALREPSFILNSLGQFSIRLIGMNSYGCVDTLIKSNYLVTLGQGYVYVPNAFSPNKNGKNDLFMPSMVNVRDQNYNFRIFNRWGELLYQTTDIKGFWDGTFKSETCEQDVYIWTVSGEYYNGDLFSFRGTVTLLR